jgi:hypothetical protein
VRRLGGVLVLTAVLAACGPVRPHAAPLAADGAVRIVAKALPLNPSDPKQDRVGDFVLAGALQLTTSDSDLLGGLSDLKVGPGDQLVSESDQGSLLRAHIVLDADGRLVGLDQAKLTLLTGLDGRPLPGKVEADAEGVAVWPSGDLMISFEHDHRIWIYPAGGGPPRAAPFPQTVMPNNAGMEGLALAPKEGADAYWVGIEGGSIWLCHLASACQQTPGQFPPPFGYRLPALFEMDDGDLVVEHHHWDPLTGNHLTIDVIDNPATNKTPKLKAELKLGPPLTLDNIEGVAVVERPGGVHRFYLISDDNFKASQRTLLMAFDWTPPAPKPATKPAGAARR